MNRIIRKKVLNPTVTQMEVEAPLISRKAKPGQFIILRADEDSERIPLTIAGTDAEEGSVKIIFQTVGASTLALSRKEAGEYIHDFAGPLGKPTETEGLHRVCVVGGGVGCAIALPVAEEFHRLGAEVTGIVGFRTKDLVILEEEFHSCCDELVLMSDDGTYGRQGNVTVPLKEMLEGGRQFDMIIAIGPLVMMKYTVLTAKPYGIPVTVSMNPIMIDGTGMCGCCRVTLVKDGKRTMKFACVDGPDFDGYEIDFDEAMIRSRIYAAQERRAYDHACHLLEAERRPD